VKQSTPKEKESRQWSADGSKTNNALEYRGNSNPDSPAVQDPDWIKLTSILNRVTKGELYITLRKGAGVKRTQDGRFRICIPDIADVVYDHDLKNVRAK
jgi:hypothetical protein